MPHPLSSTRISFLPPWTMETEILVLPASMLFSINSFTTAEGRSTTSPAAIWLQRISGNIDILPIRLPSGGGQFFGLLTELGHSSMHKLSCQLSAFKL
jgi:hypothetical protein